MVRGTAKRNFGIVTSGTRVHGGPQWRGRGNGRARGRIPAKGRSTRGNQSGSEPWLDRAAADVRHLGDRSEDIEFQDEIDEKLGFGRYNKGPSRVGWLVNMHTVSRTRRLSVSSLINHFGI